MRNLFIPALLVITIISCESSSRITSSWKQPKFKQPYSNVLIAGMTSNIEAKTTIENDMESALEKRGISNEKSMSIFPPDFNGQMSKEEMMMRIRKTSSQAILTVSLIRQETSPHYVAGTPAYTVYGNFWGYYNYWSPQVYGQGYYAQDQIYFIETNLYDVKSESLVWSAQSETYNPASLSGFSKELAGIITNRLIKDRILRAGFKPSSQKAITSRN